MAEKLEELIEAAEEASDIPKLLATISMCANRQCKKSTDDDDDWEIPAEAAHDAFYRVVKGGDAAKLELPMGTRVNLLRSLDSWKDEEAIVEVALGCIAAVGSASEEGLDQTVPALDVRPIVGVMRAYESESAIQEQACLAIEGLAKLSVDLKERLLAVQGIEGELRAAGGRITNERNKKYVRQAADALGLKL